MSCAIHNYVDTLFASIQIDSAYQQSCLEHCLENGDIYAWACANELNKNDLFMSRLIGIKKPRALQVSMHQPEKKEKSNIVKLLIPEILPHIATQRAANQQDIEQKINKLATLKAHKLGALFNYQAGILLNKAKSGNNNSVWVSDNPISYIDEFHQEVQAHLNLQSKSALQSQNNQGDANETLRVSNHVIDALHHGVDENAPACGEILMKLYKPEAFFPHQAALCGELYASLYISDISIHSFSTGVNMLSIALSYHNLVIKKSESLSRVPLKLEDVAILNEALTNTNVNSNHARILFPSTSHQTKGVFWLQLLTALLGLDEAQQQQIDCCALRQQWDIPRPFTYTIVHIQKEKQQTANRLHNELKLSYLHNLQSKPSFQEDLNYFLRDSAHITTLGDSDIRHQFSRQGGCTLLNPNRLLEHKQVFFKNYIANNGNRYFAIALLAYAEYYFLITMQNRLKIHQSETPSPAVQQRLTQQYKLLASHRVNHRFAEISRIEAHNRAYECWDKVLTISRLHKYLGEDIQDYRTVIELYHSQLTAQHEKKMQEIALKRAEQERRHDKKIKRIATMGTALIFMSGVFGTNFHEMTSVYNGKPIMFFSSDWHAVLIGLVILVTTWFFSLNAHSKSTSKGQLKRFLTKHPNAIKYGAIGVGLACMLGWGYQFWLHLPNFVMTKLF